MDAGLLTPSVIDLLRGIRAAGELAHEVPSAAWSTFVHVMTRAPREVATASLGQVLVAAGYLCEEGPAALGEDLMRRVGQLAAELDLGPQQAADLTVHAPSRRAQAFLGQAPRAIPAARPEAGVTWWQLQVMRER